MQIFKIMNIRNYKDEDYSQLKHLLEISGIYNKYIDKKEIFKRKIENYPESIIIAEEDNNIIGCIFLIDDSWNPFIMHLAVRPNYRNKGIGSILCQIAEQRLRAKGNIVASCLVGENNSKNLDFLAKKGMKVKRSIYKVVFLSKDL